MSCIKSLVDRIIVLLLLEMFLEDVPQVILSGLVKNKRGIWTPAIVFNTTTSGINFVFSRMMRNQLIVLLKLLLMVNLKKSSKRKKRKEELRKEKETIIMYINEISQSVHHRYRTRLGC